MPTTSSVSGRAPPDLAPAVRARLGELVARHGAPGGADACLARLLELLAADPHAPTAVRDPARAVESHIADSLAGLELAAVRAARTLADVGSGAGFPGLPLACSLPHARIALVESAGRKASYLTRTARALGRDNVEVVARRAEQWREGRGSQDAVLARALAPLGVILEYAAPLLRDGGVAVAWKGRRDPDEERAGGRAAEALGFDGGQVIPVAGPAGAQARYLHLYLKVRPTPERFPRRAGMAAKRPL
ncbi:MAG: 16S rRNA (guanine(527)-N(7))-methyltransferase RsmG [Actinobacteria bacterium]|nr:MAG: 16S rRNA (guanine(527)-N(7))-methyltransferase RsmG [Actinomycetota bacterium]